MSIASYIDHTILKQTTTTEDVTKVCKEALEYSFAAVCIPPIYVKEAVKQLLGSTVKVATVIGFPFGYTYTEAKLEEARIALGEGAHELDMVMNVTALKNKDYQQLEEEVKAILAISKPQEAALKVIIESGVLTDEEIVRCCEIYRQFDIDFLKTSTGYAEKGATIEAVQLIRAHLPSSIQIKASGGIRSYEFAKSLVDAGATRLGCSASVAIAKGENAGIGNY
ncbi:deoxyribose-phosphate aldolase [Flavisolibacter tropicus]|uniref:Deoxyribose-phosphate aldolase n=1 Tax=Flavisolibacter tropicus TaxID=1492898 RepID=A0A172TTN9_9BACT|nr:deoxyribose-phosphate aldolase [Flavisolibacter tropicus]ANE50356.1 deoxyribose-phosphate aldolase [Flavisolibacter tropicus]